MTKSPIPINEQKIFTGIHIEFDTTSPHATKKDMDYVAWALKGIAYMIEHNLCTSGMLSGGTAWWLIKEEE